MANQERLLQLDDEHEINLKLKKQKILCPHSNDVELAEYLTPVIFPIKQTQSSSISSYTPEQKALLLDLISKNFKFAKNVLGNRSTLITTGSKSKETVWNEIALKCNALGPSKTAVKWKKCWHGITNHTRDKVEQIHKGDDSAFDPTQYPLDVQKMFKICGINYFLRVREPLSSNQVYVVETNPGESSLFDDVKITAESFAEVKVEEPVIKCRACLKSFSPEDGQLHLLDYTYFDGIPLRTIYKELIGCNSPENESLLPAFICDDCKKLLLAFREFLGKCRSNEAHFLKIVKLLATEKTREVTFDVQVMADSSFNLPENEIKIETNILTVSGVVPTVPKLGGIGRSKRFKCSECGRLITKRANLVRHLRHYHKFEDDVIKQLRVDQQQAEELPEKNVVPKQDSNEKSIRLKCSECGRLLTARSSLVRHLKHYHKLADDIIKLMRVDLQEVLSEKALETTEEIKKIFKCADCEKSFAKKSSLVRHWRHFHKLKGSIIQQLCSEIQTNKQISSKTVCHICGVERSTESMYIHLKSHESSAQRYKCDLCGKTYKMLEALKIHLKTTHLGRIFKCQYCDLVFKSWGGRVYHTHLKHYKVKAELQCEFCDRQFPSELMLKRHIRVRHPKSKKMYACDQCDMVCASTEVLRHHQQNKHLGLVFACHICDKVFSRPNTLRTHYLIHTNEKNYQCPVCSKLFAQNCLLRSHVTRTHPNFKLPPKGTTLNMKALEKMQLQEQLEKSLVKVDFVK